MEFACFVVAIPYSSLASSQEALTIARSIQVERLSNLEEGRGKETGEGPLRELGLSTGEQKPTPRQARVSKALPRMFGGTNYPFPILEVVGKIKQRIPPQPLSPRAQMTSVTFQSLVLPSQTSGSSLGCEPWFYAKSKNRLLPNHCTQEHPHYKHLEAHLSTPNGYRQFNPERKGYLKAVINHVPSEVSDMQTRESEAGGL